MDFKFTITGGEELVAHARRVLGDAAEQIVRRGPYQEAELNDRREDTDPVLTGALRSSGRVTSPQLGDRRVELSSATSSSRIREPAERADILDDDITAIAVYRVFQPKCVIGAEVRLIRATMVRVCFAVLVAVLHASTLAAQSDVPGVVSLWGTFGTANGQFDTPSAVAVARDGTVFVADRHALQRFTASGVFLSRWDGITGRIAVGPGDQIYVARGGLISVFDAAAQLLDQWESPGSAATSRGIVDIDVDAAGDLYVLDCSRQLQKFSPSGLLLARATEGLRDCSGLDQPTGIAVVPDGNVYVSINHSILGPDVLTYDQMLQASPAGVTRGFEEIFGLGAGADGYVYAAEGLVGRIVRFGRNEPFVRFGSRGTGPGEFAQSFGLDVAVGPHGSIYVADAGNHRIQRFSEPPRLVIDVPLAGDVLKPFGIGGWAIHRGAADTGVATVHVWAYPASGSPIFLGAGYGGARPDVGAVFGAQFINSGWHVNVSDLAPGEYNLVAFAFSILSGTFNNAVVRSITVQAPVSRPVMHVDVPGSGAVVAQPFLLAGWALDLGSTSGPGVHTVHVWAYSIDGGAPLFVGAAAHGGFRPDVGAVFGAQFSASGFGMYVTGLPPGTYDLVVYARSTVAWEFNNAQVVRVTVF